MNPTGGDGEDDATDTPGSGLVWFRSAGQKRQFVDCGEEEKNLSVASAF